MDLRDKELKICDERGNEIYIRSYDEDGEDYDEAWFEYDENDNMIYFKNNYGEEEWSLYDKHNRLVNIIDQDGIETWLEYNENNCIHSKSSNEEENWFKYNEDGAIDISKEEFDEV